MSAGPLSWRATVVVGAALLALPLGACAWLYPSSEDAVVREAAVEMVEPGEGPWFQSWPAAALAEARRLHPEARGLTTRRVTIPAVGPRMQVRARGGDCWVYGGLKMGHGKWRANEIGPCA